jgi:hypothetical protein
MIQTLWIIIIFVHDDSDWLSKWRIIQNVMKWQKPLQADMDGSVTRYSDFLLLGDCLLWVDFENYRSM